MGLSPLDLFIIAAYLVGVTLFGLRFRGSQRTLKDYFLAGNTIPWWAISLSIVAAETSTLTVISVPGLAYASDFRFLQLVIGYLVGRVIVSFIFIPQYFRGDLVTAYQLIERRFGQRLRALTAGIFLVTRAAAEGVRVFAVAIVVRVGLGALLSGLTDFQRDLSAIAIVTLLTLVYTFEGGMAAVIWTDVTQLAIYVAGTIVGFFTILHLVPGGWHTVWSMSNGAQKFRLWDMSWNLSTTYTLWAGVLGGAFLTCASHGTDQLIVQRLLAARSRVQSQVALLSSGLAILLQFSLFLLIGAMLFVYYKLSPPAQPFTRTDTIFPTFIVTRMPHGTSGLLIAAILAAAMSNLSAALNSLSSTTIVDFYAHLRPRSTEARRVRLSRVATVCWGVLLFVLAVWARNGGRVLEMGLSIASVAYGSLLGVFLLGLLTRKASESGAMVGMACGFAFNMYLWLGTKVAFPWYVVMGSIVTFAIGWLASTLMPAKAVLDASSV
ncbi:sodium:solute symporter [Acidicapsa dinghuensis]|uniref:Sodium:solute symporter n=1 Tax=Acidicapsa dinghuensis TaxID=2218256 RepID=A0ABW1EMM8_9BACT|nr:sodium:solute symporter [Acidicapsa dinghuensis]